MKRHWGNLLISMEKHLINSDLSPNSVRTYFFKIKTFYRYFEVEMAYLPETQYEKAYGTVYLDLSSKNHIAQDLDISQIDFEGCYSFHCIFGN